LYHRAGAADYSYKRPALKGQNVAASAVEPPPKRQRVNTPAVPEPDSGNRVIAIKNIQ
jgi:hypothetical protein